MSRTLHVSDRVWNAISEPRATSAEDGSADILRRSRWLDEEHQRLLHLWLVGGHSIRHLARATNRNPGVLWRQLTALKTRLQDPVVAALADFGHALPTQSQQMGIEYYLLRRPMAEILRHRQLSLRDAQRLMSYLKAWSEFVPLLQQRVDTQTA